MKQQLYSIMPLNTDHLEEICQDIRSMIADGVITCPLFMFKLVPEGNPCFDKAAILAPQFILFRDRLRELGLPCGILVQCTIGHGWVLDHPSDFTHLVTLNSGSRREIICPYDEGFRSYIRNQFETAAGLEPDVIMVDDDFRLIGGRDGGCACELHQKAFSALAGKDCDRQAMNDLINSGGEEGERYYSLYLETQKEALIGAAKVMREGIDRINPRLPGSFCCVGATTEHAAEIAKILAGEGNPVTVRLNNGHYTAPGSRYFSRVSQRAAQQYAVLKEGGVEAVLAETDTCPQNRYSTSARSLHTHFTLTIFEGVQGAKHWITRLASYEPASGRAYRKILARYSGFYEKLIEIVPTLQWLGCRIPVFPAVPAIYREGSSDSWGANVLERFGIPFYYGREAKNATFLDDAAARLLDCKAIRAALGGQLFLSAGAAKILNERGFSACTGVDVTPWEGLNPSFERIYATGQKSSVLYETRRLTPNAEGVVEYSKIFHLRDAKEEIPLAPGVTGFRHGLGGETVVFSGNPNMPYNIVTAFGFLNESRKKQLMSILDAGGNLPVCYTDDAEIYLRAARMPSGELFVAVTNIDGDPLDCLPLFIGNGRTIRRVRAMGSDGCLSDLPFEYTSDGICVDTEIQPLEPAVLILG